MEHTCIAFLDVDGVLVNFSAKAITHLNSTYGLAIPEGYEPKTWLWSDVVPEHARDWFTKMPTDWVVDVPAYEGAADLTWNLKLLGARIILVTKVPMDQFAARIVNLASHGIVFDEIVPVPHGHKKSDIINAQLVRWSGLVLR